MQKFVEMTQWYYLAMSRTTIIVSLLIIQHAIAS
jgi:hypothetical protein